MSIAEPTDAGFVRAENAADRYPQLQSGEPVEPLRPRYPTLKLLIEWPLAAVIFLCVAPLLAILFVIVRLTSSGPGLYRQTRLGRGGKPYDMLKIRTMAHNCEQQTGIVWSGPFDQRVTWVGRILRDTHLDELPQLWNVLRGEMSLIGPRPERPEIVERIERVLPRYRDRMLVRPGLTGFAQIQHTADLTLDHVRRKLVYDLYYVRNMSIWLDFRIAFGTLFYFMGMTLRAIGKMAVRSHGHAVEKVIQSEKPLDVDDSELDLRATA